jgi:hypothetical protein
MKRSSLPPLPVVGGGWERRAGVVRARGGNAASGLACLPYPVVPSGPFAASHISFWYRS